MDTTQRIQVAIGPRDARLALSDALARAFPRCDVRSDVVVEQSGALVVATPELCTVEVCRELAEKATPVIILAPVPRRAEEDAYLRAGAAHYLAMDLDLGGLVAVIAASMPAGAHAPDGQKPL
jgi:hypothetical protein